MTEPRCQNCNDLLDTSHNSKDCPKCGEPLLSHIEEKTPPFYSSEPIAFLIAATICTFLLFVGIGLEGSVPIIGQICAIAAVAGMFAIGPGIYKILVSKGSKN